MDGDTYTQFAQRMELPTKSKFTICRPTILPDGKIRLNENRLPVTKMDGEKENLGRRVVKILPGHPDTPEEGELIKEVGR